MFEIAGGIILAVLFLVVGLPLAMFIFGLTLRYLKEILLGILALTAAALLITWILNSPLMEANDNSRNIPLIYVLVATALIALMLSILPMIMTALNIYFAFRFSNKLFISVLVSIICILVLISSISMAFAMVQDVIEKDLQGFDAALPIFGYLAIWGSWNWFWFALTFKLAGGQFKGDKSDLPVATPTPD